MMNFRFAAAAALFAGAVLLPGHAQTTPAPPAPAAAAPGQAATAQTASAADASATAKIHGHAQDFLYQPVTDAKVEITTDGKTALYTFPTGPGGNYTGSGIKPGTYSVILFGPIKDKSGNMTQGIMDYQKNVKFIAGQDTPVDFDMSRAEFVSRLSPDLQKQIEAARKANAGALSENTKINNINKLLLDGAAARDAKNYDQAIALDTQATQARPDASIPWYQLGTSYLDAKKYPDAVNALEKSVQLMSAEKTPKPEVIAATNNNLGEALAYSGKTADAVSAFETAAKANPTQAAMYYGNEAVVLYKVGQADGAAVAADKAIAADPSKPLPYYIKGWALVQKATVDPKTNKIVLPPGCADAYHKFLAMDPNSPLAEDAKAILQQSGETIHSTYKKR